LSIYLRENNKTFLSPGFMNNSVVPRSGYVYCARRAGKPYYHLGSVPAGALFDRLQQLAQCEKNPKDILLVGWIEVRDHATAETKLKESFHLYHRGDGWFEFKASRASEFKSLLTVYANLAEKLPLSDRLIDRDGIPDYDRSFGFFEAIHQLNELAYDPHPIASKPLIAKIASDRPKWVYGLGAAAIALVGMVSLISVTIQQSRMNEPPTPSQRPTSLQPAIQPAIQPAVQLTVKPTVKPANRQAESQPVIGLSTSDGAQRRSVPSDSESPDDLIRTDDRL
jgi:hypothetical protein